MTLREPLKRALAWTARNPLLWALLKRTIVPLGYFLQIENERPWKRQRELDEQTGINDLLESIHATDKVLNGPFKGMAYPELASVGSTLPPKLLGSYEDELHPTIEKVCGNDYDMIIDVGCAEGYYAVGMAVRVPSAKVFAFDTDETALKLCREMARQNNVADRVFIQDFCDQSRLIELAKEANRALIICDCEGYEKTLFRQNPELQNALIDHDLLIEVHDFLDVEISSELRRTFENTHTITSTYSSADTLKARDCTYSECDELTIHQRLRLVAEKRPQQMEWMLFAANT